MTQWLPFIENNWSYGRTLAREAIRQGVRPVLLTATPQRYSYLAEDGYDAIKVDTTDPTALLKQCRALAEEGGLAGITSGYEPFLPTAALLAQQLGCAGAAPQAVATCANKEATRIALARASVGAPAHRPVTSTEEALLAAQELGLPVVLKPIKSGGSIGVKLCRSLDEVAEHAAHWLHTNDERGVPMPQRILVEETIEGPEYSVEVFAGTIIGITGKHLGELPYFVESGHDFPAQLPADRAEQIRDVARAALEAVGLLWGPAHVELRYSATGPKIIEINPRLGGDNISTLIRLASGIDLYQATILAVRGHAFDLTAQTSEHAAIRFLMPSAQGSVTAADGVEAASALPGVYEARLTAKVGDRVTLHHDSRDRLGYVIAVGQTFAEAAQRADNGRNALKVVVDPAG